MSSSAIHAAALPVWSAPQRSPVVRGEPIRTAEVISALSFALDLVSGQPVGHSVRACILGMRLAQEIGLAEEVQKDLYYALLLKDAGCSSNASKLFHALGSDDIAAKRDVKNVDWTRLSWETLQFALSHAAPGKSYLERAQALWRLTRNQRRNQQETTKIRCEQGAAVAKLMGLSEQTADTIATLDEHWDGRGEPLGLRKLEIPIGSRIALLAQTLEISFATAGAAYALDVAEERSRRWFDPDLVKAAYSLARHNALWVDVARNRAFSLVVDLDQEAKTMIAGDTTLDAICLAFAQIVDAKSPFTYRHSNGVANAAVAIARTMNLRPDRVLFMRHAALLHDLGKMAVSNTILEKPGRLDEAEWKSLRLHPFYSWKILNSISGFSELSEVAASHHEKLDGSGYFRGLGAAQLSLEARILVVADIFDALSAKRPYRDALPREEVFKILRSETPHGLDAACVNALEHSGAGCDQSFLDLRTLNERLITSDQR